MAPENRTYHRRIRTLTGAILTGRLVTETHSVLCATATGGVYAQPGDLILILPNKSKLVLRKEDYPFLVEVLPTAIESLIADAARAEELFTLDELEAYANTETPQAVRASADEGR